MSDTEAVKVMSLDEQCDIVEKAFEAQFPPPDPTSMLMAEAGDNEDCCEVYPDYVIYCDEIGFCWQVNYTISAAGVEFTPREQWVKVEKQWKPMKSENVEADTLIAYGSEIKAAKDGSVGGYLVMFGTPETADFDGDFFTENTDFGFTGEIKTPVYYHHGLDGALKLRRLETDATIGIDKAGVWIKAQLALRDEYEQAINDLLIKRQKAGWSSGTASHLVARKSVGNAKEVTRWHLGLDASITPTPNDWRQVIPLKSVNVEHAAIKSLINSLQDDNTQPEAQLAEDGQPSLGAGDVNATAQIEVKTVTAIENEGENNMTDVNVAPPVDSAAKISELENALKSMGEKLDIVLKSPAVKTAEVSQPVSEADIKAAEQAAEVKAFEHYARTGERTKGLKAAINEGTSSQGGYLVPIQYSNDLVVARRYLSILRAAGAKVIKVDGTNSFKVPTMTDSAAAVLTAEAAAFDEKEPTFGEVAFVPYKYTKLVKASDEALNDSRIPVMDIVSQDATQAFAAAENAAFTTGTGSSQPQGVVTGASAGVTAAATGAITADEIIGLYHSLADLYRMNAVWMMNDATLKAVRVLKDTTNQYLWSPGLATGEPSTLLGRPVYINNNMATMATGVKSVLFGDLSYYWIADFSGMEMKRLNELYAANGQVGFTWYSRFDAHVMLSAAIKVLTQA